MDDKTVQRVVVGVDGSDCSGAALRFAQDEAMLRSVPLVPVMAWSYLDQHHADGSTDFRPDYDVTQAEAALHAVVQRELGDDPGVEVEPIARNDLPAPALLDTAGVHDLLVVGSHGRGGFRGMLLGSVSQHCVAHAPCPVVVVRDPSIRG